MTDLPTWRAEAAEALARLASSGLRFTADDLTEMVGLPDESHQPNGINSQVGLLFREASISGLIVWTGDVGRSRRKLRKGNVLRIWQGGQQ